MLTILFDGIAYGMLLFVLACGLSVTLGLMNFVNLAHGSFAMAGGYITLVLVNRAGLPFFAGLPIAFVATALIAPFTGALSDRFGRKIFISSAAFLLVFPTLLCAMADSLHWLTIFRFIQGLMLPFIFTVTIAYIEIGRAHV